MKTCPHLLAWPLVAVLASSLPAVGLELGSFPEPSFSSVLEVRPQLIAEKTGALYWMRLRTDTCVPHPLPRFVEETIPFTSILPLSYGHQFWTAELLTPFIGASSAPKERNVEGFNFNIGYQF